jgi:hypothetical protein
MDRDSDMPAFERLPSVLARYVVIWLVVIAGVCSLAIGGVFIAGCVYAIRWLLGW